MNRTLLVLCLGSSFAWAQAPASTVTVRGPDAVHAASFSQLDTFLNDAAALPDTGTVRLSAGGGVLPGLTEQGATVAPGASAQALWTPLDRIALTAGASFDQGHLGALGGVRVQLLRQAQEGVDVQFAAGVRSVGYEGLGAAVDARLGVGRQFGALLLQANARIARAFGERDDADLEGSALAAWNFGDRWMLGLEARAHGELIDNTPTPEDDGRPVGMLGGAVAGVRLGALSLQAIAGAGLPRGPYAAGPMAMLRANYDF